MWLLAHQKSAGNYRLNSTSKNKSNGLPAA